MMRYLQPFANVTGHYTKGMVPMLKHLKLKQIGRHHSGIGQYRSRHRDVHDL